MINYFIYFDHNTLKMNNLNKNNHQFQILFHMNFCKRRHFLSHHIQLFVNLSNKLTNNNLIR